MTRQVYLRCTVPTCSALLFERERDAHLRDVHGQAPVEFVPLADVAYNTGAHHLCECGNPKATTARVCSTCLPLEHRHTHVVATRSSEPTANALAQRRMRDHAKAEGRCSICTKRKATPGLYTCKGCRKAAARRKAQGRRRRAA